MVESAKKSSVTAGLMDLKSKRRISSSCWSWTFPKMMPNKKQHLHKNFNGDIILEFYEVNGENFYPFICMITAFVMEANNYYVNSYNGSLESQVNQMFYISTQHENYIFIENFFHFQYILCDKYS